MYNNNGQNNQGNFNQGNGNMNPPNPNGGYLKPGQRQDQWYGNLTITPELLAEIQRTGKVRINVNEVKTNQYGPARRMTAKAYTEVQRPQQCSGRLSSSTTAVPTTASATDSKQF
jgi:hypothetical protein